jgi:alanine-glyoxylate transaminase/serine-glyoxylate transaminase/serine-pyruvate transaminase
MAQPTPRHYGPEWVEVHNEVEDLLKQVFQTRNDLFVVPGPGSALLDMALGSLLAPGETVIVGDNGFFGQRFGTIARTCGLEVVPFTAPLGQPLDPGDLRRLLAQHPETRAVALVHHETSTTVLNPLQELAEVIHQAGLPIILDAVSSLGGVPLPVDGWGIDVCVTVANKCLECPPGLAFISVGPRAWEWVDRHQSQTHGWYLNLQTWRRYATEWADWHPFPTTMPTNVVMGLWASLRRLVADGLEANFARYQRAAQVVRQGLAGAGFEMFVQGPCASPIVTAVRGRPEFEVGELLAYLAGTHGILVSGGIGALSGQIFRVGHMGKANTRPYLIEFLLAVETFLRQQGLALPVGASLAAIDSLAGVE